MHMEFQEAIKAKIPVLHGRDAKNNKLVLETLALRGPLSKYRIFKNLEPKGLKHYPTISRRVDNLKERGYIDCIGKRITTVGKNESTTYSLTWRGVIASLTMEIVRREIPNVLEKALRNPLLKLPFSREIAIGILKKQFTPTEIEIIAGALLQGFLRVIPWDIESIEEEKYFAYIVPAITEIPEIKEQIKVKDFVIRTQKLLEIPGFLPFILELINNFESQLSDSLYTVELLRMEFLSSFILKLKNNPLRTGC